ncbi:glycosyltransferase [Alkalilimnicola sp. S0819]|uniref:glycosyltransferase n=1 Tax=Alkalilimnicola sp. S0819 TaxID=2613922 RepID=UPI0012616CC4|nr:glycosyltransferase [Alkalilimnicola sp. S0819]KAB7627885.1 glycosyltransferase [Alkalilimnicola sp. S0819]MPQ15521.1 glycosyltransferase [Alkalilimnicola sp. S0819]
MNATLRQGPAPVPPAAGGLRVCHIIDTLKYGGAERQFVSILNAMPVAKKFAVVLRDQGQPGFAAQLAPEITLRRSFMRVRSSPWQIWRLARWLRRQRIDVVHTHMFWPSLYGTLAARLAGVPVVVTTDHGIGAWKRPRHHWLDGQLIGRAADLRFCVSGHIARMLHERCGVPARKLQLVVNGTEVPEPVSVGERPVVRIGTLGRMVWQKDFRTLIEAAALLRDWGLPFELCLLGDGPQRAELETLVRQRGLGGQVSMPGFQSDVDGWLRRFDIFALSSVEEGQPVSLLEAMARGLAVAATRVGAIPATLRDGQEGLLVRPGSAAELAEALGRLCTDADLRRRLGEAARERVLREFSSEALARRYLAVYARLYARRGGGDAFPASARTEQG